MLSTPIIMTKEQMARSISGNEYLKEVSPVDRIIARNSGLLIIYGASDDITIFDGVIRDEAGAWEGALHKILRNGDIFCRDDLHDEIISKGYSSPKVAINVTAEFAPDDVECTWRIKTDVPFAPFNIFDDGELYCIGAVVEFLPDRKAD
jgi:hypothetical protein